MPIILYMTLPEDQKIRIEDLFQKFGESERRQTRCVKTKRLMSCVFSLHF